MNKTKLSLQTLVHLRDKYISSLKSRRQWVFSPKFSFEILASFRHLQCQCPLNSELIAYKSTSKIFFNRFLFSTIIRCLRFETGLVIWDRQTVMVACEGALYFRNIASCFRFFVVLLWRRDHENAMWERETTMRCRKTTMRERDINIVPSNRISRPQIVFLRSCMHRGFAIWHRFFFAFSCSRPKGQQGETTMASTEHRTEYWNTTTNLRYCKHAPWLA
jgi:hypothetical protein